MGGHNGVKKGLFNDSGTALGLEGLYGQNAANINSTLTPELTAEAVNPQGYTPTQMASQTTAAEQTAGGSNAGATGGALLRAVRTRNAGAVAPAVGASNRAAGEELSQVNSGIQTRNADLQQRQRQQGLSGLESLYGTNVGAGENALGLSEGALNDAGNLKNFWQQYLLGAQAAAGQAAAGAGA
jgi:hypothetical protein